MGKDEIILYHGSKDVVVPRFGEGKTYNDYGRGFYCTESEDLAGEWACAHATNGCINVYRLNMTELTCLNLNNKQFNIINWLAILLENRSFNLSDGFALQAKNYILQNFLPDYKNYDIIRGYRADDSYFAFASDFINNNIPLSVLKRAMMLGKLREQVVLKSEKAFSAITLLEAHEASASKYFSLYSSRDRQARQEYADIKTRTFEKDDVFMLDILRGEWKNGDARL